MHFFIFLNFNNIIYIYDNNDYEFPFFFYIVLLYDLTQFSNVCKIDNTEKKNILRLIFQKICIARKEFICNNY